MTRDLGLKEFTGFFQPEGFSEGHSYMERQTINIHCRGLCVGTFNPHMRVATGAPAVQKVHIKQIAQETELLPVYASKTTGSYDSLGKVFELQGNPSLQPGHLGKPALFKSTWGTAPPTYPQNHQGSEGKDVTVQSLRVFPVKPKRLTV